MTAATQRQHMILGQLYTNDIVDKRILDAMADIAREPFLPEALRGAAYVDDTLQVRPGRYQLTPLTFAMLLDLAKITPACRILNIGALTGYTTAILGNHVTAIDTDADALAEARAHMKRLGIANAIFQQVASMAEGYAASAPYDVILINGAIADLPDAVAVQLALTGRLVAVRNVATRPGIPGGLGKGMLVERIEHRLQYREHFDAGAMLLPGFGYPTGFVF
jgi:protein-L-isoaspartate(D-aspartate) O-methyltransferase